MNPSATTNNLETKERNIATSPLPVQKMHNIVLAMVGLFFLMAATYPFAFYRVTQKSDGWGEKVKVKGVYLKTLDDAKKPTIQPTFSQSTEKK
jgi:hypothetical protein